MENRENKRKILTGTVISDKMTKTCVVRVMSPDLHKRFHKRIVRHQKFKAHDEKNEAHIGDTVTIQETRPLSKDKRWIVTKVDGKAVTKEAVDQ